MNFVPLYIKTDNSLLNSMIKISDLVKYALKNNIKALTITDNNMYGVMEFYTECINNKIKPIVGLEINYNNITFVLYAKNIEGYYNLVKLSTLISENNLDFESLKNNSSDLILILPFEYKDNNIKSLYKDIFIGVKDIYEYNSYNENNSVYFNKVLYLEENDYIYINYLKSIRDGSAFSNELLDNDLKEFSYIEKNYPKTLVNLSKIVDMCNLKIEKRDDLLPKYTLQNSYEMLKDKVKEGIKRIFGKSVPKVYIDRCKYELDVINKMGFCDYFLIVSDYVSYAKGNGILVGPGRGSAAGSLVSYLLDITEIDPIRYNLLFERFLNPSRVTMPDIDIDFDYMRREEVINYCINKYGKKRVAGIITFSTFGAKQAIRDICKIKNIDLKETDYICGMIDSKYNLKENYDNSSKIRDFINKSEIRKSIYKIAIKIEGLKRQTSVHACGIVICSKDLDSVIPLKYQENIYLTGYDMNYLEKLGLLKMDFLGLKNLTIIDSIIKDINDPNISFSSIPLNDRKTLDLFKCANTIGIFQFESKGMIDFLRRFKPDSFEDLFAAIALYRPGPMDNIGKYIDRKNGIEEITYIDPCLEDILKSTYGIIIYQEQIMRIASVYAGYTLSEADILRRAISKKKENVLIEQRNKFIEKASKCGRSVEQANKIYDMILKFASYGFNRSHSVAYAIISYKMAYLKAHYPSLFMKQLLNMSISSNVKEYLYEAKLNNVEILKPDINLSSNKYEDFNGKLRIPFNSIKGISLGISSYIIRERENGKYKDIYDFIKRMNKYKISRNIIESLILAGCFDNEFNRKTLFENLDLILNYASISLDIEDGLIEKPELNLYREYTKKELMKIEHDIFGFYLSYHPVTEIRIEKGNSYDILSVGKSFNKRINIILEVNKKKELKTKNNDLMCFLTCSDELSEIDVVVFPDIYKEINVKEGDIINLTARVEKRFDKYQLLANKIEIL